MDMKRLWTLLAALFLCGSALNAQTTVKTFDVDDFTGISADNAFDVTLKEGSSYEVIVEVTDEFMPYVLVNNKRGVLQLTFDRLPFKLRQKTRHRVAKATVTMPKVTYIDLSGAAKLYSGDLFTNTMRKCSIKLRGASNIEYLELKTPDLEIELDGASRAQLKLRSSDVDVDVAGASKVEITGETTDLRVKANGASRFEGKEFEAREVDVVASGASSVDVRVGKKLSVNLSGASKCRYYGDEDKVTVKAEKVAGASSLKHKK